MSDHRHTRRDALKFFGAGAAAAWAWPGAAQQPAPGGESAGPGLFPAARRAAGPGTVSRPRRLLDAVYLLQLEPDRMLHNFRVNAGLEPKAPVYGGWESHGALDRDPLPRTHAGPLPHAPARACTSPPATRAFADRVDYIVARARRVPGKRPAAGSRRFPMASRRSPTASRANHSPACPGTPRTRCSPGLRDAHLHPRQRGRARGAGEVRRLDRRGLRRRARGSLPEDARPRAWRHERSVRRPVAAHAGPALSLAGAALLAPGVAGSAVGRT